MMPVIAGCVQSVVSTNKRVTKAPGNALLQRLKLTIEIRVVRVMEK